MRKIALFLIIALLVGGLACPSFAAKKLSAGYGNAIKIDGTGDVTEPPMFVKRVRYGLMGLSTSGLSSGDVVKWDTNSADGVTVSACTATTDTPCGVLVTDLVTQDTTSLVDSKFGEMCVSGYCLAKIDTSEATTGGRLVISDGNTAAGKFFGTYDNSSITNVNSRDCGVLLNDPGADANGPVWLNLN